MGSHSQQFVDSLQSQDRFLRLYSSADVAVGYPIGHMDCPDIGRGDIVGVASKDIARVRSKTIDWWLKTAQG